MKRLGREGDSALRHKLRGRVSNRKTPEAVKRRVVELFLQKKQAKLWHDYGPTLAAEELAEDYGIRVNRETLRQWLDAEEQSKGFSRPYAAALHAGRAMPIVSSRWLSTLPMAW